MIMPSNKKPVERFCRICGKSLGFYVKAKYCPECAGIRTAASIIMQRFRRGPDFEKYLKNRMIGYQKYVKKLEDEFKLHQLRNMPKLTRWLNSSSKEGNSGIGDIQNNNQKDVNLLQRGEK